MPTSALHVARTGLEAQDARMRVIANNLANVGTTGFKRDRANFATLAYQDARVAGQQSSSETAYAIGLNLGTGVGVQSTTRIDDPGLAAHHRQRARLALDGDGYFQVQLPGGQLGYTRAGNFTRSAEGQLVTTQGYPVLPPISVPEGATSRSHRRRRHGFGHRRRHDRRQPARPDHRCQLRQSGGAAGDRRQLPARDRRQRRGPDRPGRRSRARQYPAGHARRLRTSMSSRSWST